MDPDGLRLWPNINQEKDEYKRSRVKPY